MRRAQEGKGIDIRPVHDDRDTYGRICMEIIDPVDELPRCEHRHIHRGCQEARSLLCYVNALIHLARIEVSDLRFLADVQIVRTRCSCRPARHRDRREIRLRFEDDCDLLRLRGIVQMVVEDARIPRHRVAIEDACLLDILGAVREEQCAARIVGFHRPTVHEV